MSERKITIKIDPLGNPEIEAHGFAGQSCANATDAIEKALQAGDGEMTKVMKDEWHQSEDQSEEQTVSW